MNKSEPLLRAYYTISDYKQLWHSDKKATGYACRFKAVCDQHYSSFIADHMQQEATQRLYWFVHTVNLETLSYSLQNISISGPAVIWINGLKCKHISFCLKIICGPETYNEVSGSNTSSKNITWYIAGLGPSLNIKYNAKSIFLWL